ncbi:uncharacterized protein BDW70DRAFT_149064 [Aspergillus foveolatus]|uniref:uncharacterized protein n=1 Tax=Aspergillus foveolatus TaxID=210207 RepID=UPI003CCE4977
MAEPLEDKKPDNMEACQSFSPQYQTLLSASLYAGLFTVWQLSIFGVSIVTLLAASSPNWKAVNVWTALLAIDLTVLTESLPKKWSFLFTGLACIWGLGNAITALISWPLVVSFCCPSGASAEMCTRSNNMGWRYIDIVPGSLCLIMSIARSWLVARGRTEDAVVALNKINFKNWAEYNADTSQFCCLPDDQISKRTWLEEISSIKELFLGRRNLRLMSCLFLLWAFVGIWYTTLFFPRGTLFLTSCICAVFAGLFTQVRTEAQTPLSQTKHLGVGCGLLMACGRLVSISAPFIATFGDVMSGVPLWVSCAMYVRMGLLGLSLPRLS